VLPNTGTLYAELLQIALIQARVMKRDVFRERESVREIEWGGSEREMDMGDCIVITDRLMIDRAAKSLRLYYINIIIILLLYARTTYNIISYVSVSRRPAPPSRRPSIRAARSRSIENHESITL